MSEFKNVSFVSDDNMCTGCGVCVAVCPHDVISMLVDEAKGVYQSNVNLETCTDCTICLKSCPPLTWSNEPKTQIYNEMVGDYVAGYATYSNDEYIRRDSASGGFITTLLLYLLEKGLIQGAVVTKRDENNPLISKPFIATTKEEIINAKGSKYSPVKFDEILHDIIEGDYENLAVVGLPCHIEGVARAAQKSKKLSKKIKYKISIVCGQAPSFLGYEYIAKKFEIETNKITELKNRGDGWPGYMEIQLDSKNIKVPYGSKYSMGTVLSSPLFTPLACQMCADAVGFNADVSVSDAWLEKYMDDKQGVNLILTKNRELDEIIKQMGRDDYITLIDENINEFIKANKSVIHNKSKFNNYRLDKFIGPNRELYSQKMLNNYHVSFTQKIKLIIFTWHLKIIKKLDIKKIVPKLNDKVLFYLKALNLLKR
ncbi:Coenzyme F420 hydrogenase/dehydrogenase, beta subunit C-terminal domain [Sulfurimonas sp.]|uniref:Coenzyme F420 hydrogenase/dehydrogenase, beta subunit C-terminal domain n=1 Tax=Sulfurimonas sp. TaxID=2022749 RepID=UPI001A021A1D|nr:Coenzyme F420 hydrogenase/dehydrogenase, beta subunit C-terminal domain [Sulfurimonas sp.]MBE0515395.1 Coenzyme F420 hydrogenase/dehydrogenase, beta subunit C-terminal domain [Sulfurimonas sp.]